MRIAVTGSIATDHLMSFPGRFAEQFLPDQLDRISLSFLVDDLVVRRGGVAGNMAYGMAQLGLRPILVGAVGADFDDYRSWLERHGVDCESAHVSDVAHTARFVCTTDRDMCQIASFYPGAMSEAREIELEPIADRVGGLDLVIIGANDPEAMLRHTEECRQRGIPFAADPSQQLAFMEGAQVRQLVEGAAYLLTNEYERGLLENKTGWSRSDVLERVDIQLTTLGANGVEITGRGIDPVHVPATKPQRVVDPTGVGDSFRSGFLAGVSWGLGVERAAQVGHLMAGLVIETDGPQEHDVKPADFVERARVAYGDAAADEIGRHFGA